MSTSRIALQVARSGTAIILGEVLLSAGTWFVQERLFGHVTYSDTQAS